MKRKSDRKTPTDNQAENKANYWLEKILSSLQRSVDYVMEAGQYLIQAKEALKHGEWLKLFEDGRLPFGERRAQYYMKIARHPVLSNPNNRSYLPRSRTALLELCKGEEKQIESLISQEKIHSSLKAKDVRCLVRGEAGIESERDADHELCKRRLKTLEKYIEEAKSWESEMQQTFRTEISRLVECLSLKLCRSLRQKRVSDPRSSSKRLSTLFVVETK